MKDISDRKLLAICLVLAVLIYYDRTHPANIAGFAVAVA